jgi:hypothetical protein
MADEKSGGSQGISFPPQLTIIWGGASRSALRQSDGCRSAYSPHEAKALPLKKKRESIAASFGRGEGRGPLTNAILLCPRKIRCSILVARIQRFRSKRQARASGVLDAGSRGFRATGRFCFYVEKQDLGAVLFDSKIDTPTANRYSGSCPARARDYPVPRQMGARPTGALFLKEQADSPANVRPRIGS